MPHHPPLPPPSLIVSQVSLFVTFSLSAQMHVTSDLLDLCNHSAACCRPTRTLLPPGSQPGLPATWILQQVTYNLQPLPTLPSTISNKNSNLNQQYRGPNRNLWQIGNSGGMSTIGHWQIDASSGMPKHSQGGDNSGRRYFQACIANSKPPIRSNNSITSCLWNLKPKEACYGQVFYFLFSFPRVHAVLFISRHCSDFILAFKCVHTGAISYVSPIIFF